MRAFLLGTQGLYLLRRKHWPDPPWSHLCSLDLLRLGDRGTVSETVPEKENCNQRKRYVFLPLGEGSEVGLADWTVTEKRVFPDLGVNGGHLGECCCCKTHGSTYCEVENLSQQ